ncbi:MAG: alpha-D-ribose 1-methylphosphonate 5-triphosphate diphosphatase [Proteobacteria bacterium]|nr:alpha-D-ribose 1-methylphosphonate 5-triphosphate diphosphatase [Pseudomonadota bacterium]
MTADAGNLVIANARLVLADRVVEPGWVAAVAGAIVDYGEGPPPRRGEDANGDFVLPGLIELHTDHLESHYLPRPKVYWDPVAAVVAHDAQMATSGMTTVLDSLRVWREDVLDGEDGDAVTLAKAISAARDGGLLRAEHFVHLRCEVGMPNVVALARDLVRRDDIRLVSIMDHTPGQRQFRDEEKLRDYYRGRNGGMTDAELDAMFAHLRRLQLEHGARNQADLVALAHARGAPLASHDDTTREHVAQALASGVAIAEFPTTLEAAAALHAAGIRVLMGAPNLVRGGSHSGNIASRALAQAGILDILSSDYVPASSLMAAFMLPDLVAHIDLAAAVRMVSKTAAEAVGLHDRGEIAKGRRADVIRVQVAGGVPVVRGVWRQGSRVA